LPPSARPPGYGTLDAATCPDLADTLAITGRARWCITLTDQRGRAVAHGCARAGPGPPGSDQTAWLATVTIHPIETSTCAHRRESLGYQPSDSLRHIVTVRSRRCGFPGAAGAPNGAMTTTRCRTTRAAGPANATREIRHNNVSSADAHER
jgi:hypothetical protein